MIGIPDAPAIGEPSKIVNIRVVCRFRDLFYRIAVFLQAAEQSIDDAINAAKNKSPLELIEIDISSAYENLGFITGDSVREDVIDQVFSRFCLGK